MFPKKSQPKRKIYLDHAAATPVDASVLRVMQPFFTTHFANPSALYNEAVVARGAIETARQEIANVLFTQSDTIFFTSGGTESANAAIFGVRKKKKSGHIITTAIEHHAVLEPILHLEKAGWSVTYLSVNQSGQIDVEEFRKSLRSDTMLVSVMYANNEIGTIQPIADVGREILKWRKEQKTEFPYFHTDACQAGPYLDLTVNKLHVDFMSLNASKIYGPKGVGILYKRRGVGLESFLLGGGQEMGLRSGTENVPGIVGMATALTKVQKEKEIEFQRLEKLRNYFWDEIERKITEVILNGPKLRRKKTRERSEAKETRLPNNLHVTFTGADAEALILYLDAYGIVCSSGSACTTDSDEASHVLLACGVREGEAKNSLRFTLGKSTTKKDINFVMKYLPGVVAEVRKTNI